MPAFRATGRSSLWQKCSDRSGSALIETSSSSPRVPDRPDIFPFLQLPQAVRFSIYRLVLANPTPLSPSQPGDIDLLQTCRYTRDEARQVYYAANRFVLLTERDAHRFLIGIRSRYRWCLASLTIDLEAITPLIFNQLIQCQNLFLYVTATLEDLMWLPTETSPIRLHDLEKITITQLRRRCHLHDSGCQARLAVENLGLPVMEMTHILSECANECPYHGEQAHPGPRVHIHIKLEDCCLSQYQITG